MRISARRRREVVRGFKLVGNLLFGFVTIMLVMAGVIVLKGGEPGRIGKVGACFALVIGAGILFSTANSWKTWIAGFFGLPGVGNGISTLISGHMPAWPYKPVPRTDAILLLAFVILLTVLTFPSADFRKPSDPLSRACLAAAIIALFMAIVSAETNYGWLGCCLGLFLTVRVRILIEKSRVRRTHRRGDHTDQRFRSTTAS